MKIQDYPKKWLQSGFHDPYEVYVTDIVRSDKSIVVYPVGIQDEEEDKCNENELFETLDAAQSSLNDKLKTAESMESFMLDYYWNCCDVQSPFAIGIDRLNRYVYYEQQIDVLQSIIKAYRTHYINIDAKSIRIDNVATVGYLTPFTSVADAGDVSVVVTLLNGEKLNITLRTRAEKEVFAEFFGEDKSSRPSKLKE